MKSSGGAPDGHFLTSLQKDLLVTAILLWAGCAYLLLMINRAPLGAGGRREFFDSPAYGWSWIVVPLLVALAAALRPSSGVWPTVWAIAMIAPQSVAVVALRSGVDVDEAALWPLGLVLTLVNGAIGAGVGHAIVAARARPTRRQQ